MTRYVYDQLNRLIATIDALGNAVTNIYDADGRVTATINALGTTTYTYDFAGRQQTVEEPSAGVTTTLYNGRGQVTSVTDQLSHTTTYLYDAAGRETAVVDPLSGTTTTLYDKAGNLTEEIDPDGNVTAFLYDNLNRETEMTDPLGNSTTMAYDALGRLTSQTDRLGRRIDYSYDTSNQLTGETWYDSTPTLVNTLTFTYDAAGNMLTAGSSAGAYTMAYDQNNQVTQVQGLFGVTLTMSYDAQGNRTQLADSFGGVQTSVYDAVERLATQEFGGSGLTSVRVDLGYNATNELSLITRYSDLAGTSLVGTASYAYDSTGRMTNIVQKNSGGTALATYAYGHDKADRVTTETTAAGVTTFSYDNASEVTNDSTQAYSYDANGNRTMTGYATGTDNQMTNDGVFTYTYDLDGNLSIKSKGTGLEKWYYSYDNLDHLTSVRQTSNGITNLMVATYTYDVFGNRVEEDKWFTGGSTSTVKHIYDGSQDLYDLNSSNVVQMHYVWGNQANQALARVDGSGTLMFYGTDWEGSVRTIINGSGVQDTITYDAFGNKTETTPALGGSVLYTGMYLDRDTGLYGTPNRDYDPDTAKWLQFDPSGFSAGDANLYRYVGNDATNGVDPSGLVEDTVTATIKKGPELQSEDNTFKIAGQDVIVHFYKDTILKTAKFDGEMAAHIQLCTQSKDIVDKIHFIQFVNFRYKTKAGKTPMERVGVLKLDIADPENKKKTTYYGKANSGEWRVDTASNKSIYYDDFGPATRGKDGSGWEMSMYDDPQFYYENKLDWTEQVKTFQTYIVYDNSKIVYSINWSIRTTRPTGVGQWSNPVVKILPSGQFSGDYTTLPFSTKDKQWLWAYEDAGLTKKIFVNNTFTP